MADIKGISYKSDNVNFLSANGGVIDHDITIYGDCNIDGNLYAEEIIEPLKIVTFSDGTDEEIATMLDAHYRGDINIEDYWHVGDTRVVHIDATNSGTQDHAAQNMTMVIMDFNHDDLTTPINNRTKAAVSVGFREVLEEPEYYWGSSHWPVTDAEIYPKSPLRTWLNGELLNALPNTFGQLIKEVNKKNCPRHKSNMPGMVTSLDDSSIMLTSFEIDAVISSDKIWLLSYTEVFGNEYYSYYDGGNNYEGEQYEYMKTSANRIKKRNNNGTQSSNGGYYWLRSPSSFYLDGDGYNWCYVNSDGEIENEYGDIVFDLAPAFAL